MRDDRREWDRLAEADAMWAVHSAPGHRGAWTADAFLATGREEVDGMMRGLEEQGLRPAAGEALDFGCGLGRLSRALTAHFGAVTGVDHSAEMLARARELHAGTPGLAFLVNQDEHLAQFASGRFDLVLSLITLQHVASPRVAVGYLRELARVCAPGGVVVVQVPERVGWRIRLHPGRVLNAVVRRSPIVPARLGRRLLPWSMRLVAVPEARVRAALEAEGATVVTAFPDRRTGSDAAPSLLYVARKR